MQAGLIQKLSAGLNGDQRRQLRGLAHGLKPVVQVGHLGATEQVAKQLDVALYDHELVKVRVLNNYEGDMESVAIGLTESTQSACVQQIGRILLFYRANPDEPVIVLK